MKDSLLNNKDSNKIPIFPIIIFAAFLSLIVFLGIYVAITEKQQDEEKTTVFKGKSVIINNSYITKVESMKVDTTFYTSWTGLLDCEIADNIFIILKFTIENLSKSNLYVSSTDFELIMEGGYKYEPKRLISSEGFDLIPFQTITFTIVFDAIYPPSEKNYTLKYGNYLFFQPVFECYYQLF